MCLFFTGITDSICDFSTGGLNKVYLANKSEIASISKNAQNVVTGITMTGGAKFYAFDAAVDTSQFLEELQTGTANRFFNQTINFVITNITQQKKNVLEALALAKVAAIVQYPDNTYKLAGEYGRGLQAVTLTNDSGTAIADLAGATVSIVGAGRMANEVNSTAVLAVID